MAKKRGQNEGTIAKRPDGSWWARITIGVDSQGRQKRKAFYGKTRADVHAKMTAALNELQIGNFVYNPKMTLGNWLVTWLNEYAINSVKHSTRVSYEMYITKHINPFIGKVKLVDLKTDIIQKFYNEKLENGRIDGYGGLSPKTIKNIHNLLHKALDQGLENGLINKNPTEFVQLPKITKTKMRVLYPKEHKKIIEASYTEKYGFIVRLALETGMRLGELTALQWRDINLSDKSLIVSRTLNRLKNYDKSINSKTVLVEGEPKTKNSMRSIPLSTKVIEELKIIKVEQIKNKEIWKQGYNEKEYIFANELGKPIEPRTMQDVFKNIVAKANIRNTNFHALRHTFATRALEAGIQSKVVSEILGHSTVGITLDLYSHVSLDVKRDAIRKINEHLDKDL